jgi:acylphosphatase
MKRVHIIVRGVVQGVGFRWATAREAKRFSLQGYVRNLPSGEVEIVAEGDDSAVDRLVAWAKHGPSWAFVEGLDVTPEAPKAEFTDFSVR